MGKSRPAAVAQNGSGLPVVIPARSITLATRGVSGSAPETRRRSNSPRSNDAPNKQVADRLETILLAS
jgi:hypothetical protein